MRGPFLCQGPAEPASREAKCPAGFEMDPPSQRWGGQKALGSSFALLGLA